MINYKEAKKILIKSKIKIKDEIINSSKSLNRINVLDIYSGVNYPAGTNAAFDGFAINSKDTNKLNKNNSQNFKILKTISAGDNPSLKKINKFEAVEVMTGALIPKNFDTIIPIEKIIYGLDFMIVNKQPLLSVNGWTKKTNVNLFDYIKKNYWIKNILATDISLDGTLQGPNIGIYKKILKNKNLNLIASGGIGSIYDIKKLQSINSQECVVGKAIYECKISLKDLQKC